MLESSDKTFHDDLRRAGRRAVLVFWAEWARRSKDVSHFCRTAEQMAGDAAVLSVNTDLNPVTVHAFQVQRVPTVAIVADGAVVWTIEGLPEQEAFQSAWRAGEIALLP
jgi:thioredoxin-like negative regulator of GroEL